MLRRLLAASALSLALAPAGAGASCDDKERICASGSPWYTLGGMELRSNFGDAEGAFAMSLMSRNDLHVRYRIGNQGETNEGEVLLIGGRVLALKGGRIEAGYEIDYLDGPVLTMQLVVSLLHVAIPEGPRAVQSERKLSVHEDRRRIDVATASASGNYGAPWTVAGTVKRSSPESLAFDLEFSFMPLDPFGRKTDGKAQTIRFTGTLDYPAARGSLPDDFSLADWKVLGLGPQREQRGSSTILDYRAGAYPGKPRTVGEVRATVKRDTDPGTPDPRRDFVGFWKEKCEQNFGLHIARAGTDGMYSVSFCGPGGCFEPGTYRPNTYINGDRSYQIVSESEIRILGGDGWSTYRKCGTQPPPVRKK